MGMFDLILKGFFPHLFFAFGGGGSGGGGSDVQEAPKYTPSEYDAPSSKSIYDFYEPRTRGEKTGYSQEDLSTMNAQVEDATTRNANEMVRRGAAGRRLGYGGTSTGGTNRVREQAIQSGLEYRSNAMRDIAIKNAVQKHQDQWNAAGGLQNFLNAERSHALSKWTGEASMYNTQTYADAIAGSQAAQGSNDMMSGMGEVGSNLLQKYLEKNMFETNKGF